MPASDFFGLSGMFPRECNAEVPFNPDVTSRPSASQYAQGESKEFGGCLRLVTNLIDAPAELIAETQRESSKS